MKACIRCGSSVTLRRFDREQNAWTCVSPCNTVRTKSATPHRPWKKREALFSIWVLNPDTGERVRATRDELREASRLWYQHRDIREGRA